MNMNSSAGMWKFNQFIDEALIAVFLSLQSCFFPQLKKRDCNIIKASKVLLVFLIKLSQLHQTADRRVLYNFSEVR